MSELIKNDMDFKKIIITQPSPQNKTRKSSFAFRSKALSKSLNVELNSSQIFNNNLIPHKSNIDHYFTNTNNFKKLNFTNRIIQIGINNSFPSKDVSVKMIIGKKNNF